MEDYGISFERICTKFLAASAGQIYYSGYYGDNFLTRAILTTILIKERAVNFATYSLEDQIQLDELDNLLSSGNSSHAENIRCIEFLMTKL